jgi:hypothetical protein
LSNFHALLAISSAISSNPIYRLKHTFAALSDEAIASLQDLEYFVSNDLGAVSERDSVK